MLLAPIVHSQTATMPWRPPLDDAVVYEEVPLSEMEYEDDMNYY